ncbi:hypothetical protein BDV96DRAFT_638442 [Lophiotrema nucula]|uniref:Uncharacterized protein n=1 Tax=Lophiotrema nucula TaxID=690887 RepID=A0A6A5YFH7_9PLEO|nr:hypothetical protein BDV96DRAFT_638442 [Lophiotrema nucula]
MEGLVRDGRPRRRNPLTIAPTELEHKDPSSRINAYDQARDETSVSPTTTHPRSTANRTQRNTSNLRLRILVTLLVITDNRPPLPLDSQLRRQARRHRDRCSSPGAAEFSEFEFHLRHPDWNPVRNVLGRDMVADMRKQLRNIYIPKQVLHYFKDRTEFSETSPEPVMIEVLAILLERQASSEASIIFMCEYIQLLCTKIVELDSDRPRTRSQSRSQSRTRSPSAGPSNHYSRSQSPGYHASVEEPDVAVFKGPSAVDEFLNTFA